MPRGKPFEKGHKLAPGGPRPNSGRPPNEFREWLGNIIHSETARERFRKIIEDDEGAEEKVTEQGVCVPVRARAQTYLQALELGLSFLESKAPTDINVNQSELAAAPTDLVQSLIAAFEGGTVGRSESGTGTSS